jgi:hypothetical protein
MPFEKIVKIEPIGEDKFYDLEMPTHHNYFLNGILHHNSGFRDKTKTGNASSIYNVLNSSATTRFGSRAKGMIISYPRYSGDFTEQMYELSKTELWIYGDKGATWEWKPREFFSPKTFEFEGHTIPWDFKKDFDTNPTDAKCKLLCLPPVTESPFIEYPEKIDLIVVDKPNMFEVETSYEKDPKNPEKGYVRKYITKWNPGRWIHEYAIVGDLGLSNCECAICISHKEKDKLIIDYIDSWAPKKGRKEGFVVDIENVLEFIQAIASKIRISKIRFDRWNSAMLLQLLDTAGFNAKPHSLHYMDYKRFLDMIYSKKMELPNHPQLISQIKNLQLLDNNKVDRSEKEFKDEADTVVGSTKVWFGEERVQQEEDGEFVGNNLSGLGGLHLRRK